MMKSNQRSTINPVLYAVRKFFGKMLQNPEIYPIKYYKKGHRYRRAYPHNMVK